MTWFIRNLQRKATLILACIKSVGHSCIGYDQKEARTSELSWGGDEDANWRG